MRKKSECFVVRIVARNQNLSIPGSARDRALKSKQPAFLRQPQQLCQFPTSCFFFPQMFGPARQLFRLSSRPRGAVAAASTKARFYSSRSPISSRPNVSFEQLVSRPDAKYQIYRTLSNDPFLNLCIEHFLLQHTPPDSYILLLYVNRPSVVIGRNQNPWLEANLYQVDDGRVKRGSSQEDRVPLLIRRRSGGGAVFHDEGNLNFSVIHPRGAFDRNRHAEMVARALRQAGATHARVNERHDIVLDNFSADPGKSTVKISGSAYKLTRLRAMHHGTCLVDSPNINCLGRYLRSPAQAFITAKGVESVRSAVGNVSAALDEPPSLSVVDRVASLISREFAETYGISPDAFTGVEQQHISFETTILSNDDWIAGVLSDDYCLNEPGLGEGLRELNVSLWHEHRFRC